MVFRLGSPFDGLPTTPRSGGDSRRKADAPKAHVWRQLRAVCGRLACAEGAYLATAGTSNRHKQAERRQWLDNRANPQGFPKVVYRRGVRGV